MRISGDKTDRGYRTDYMHFKASLDGQDIPLCISADEEEGWALVVVQDEKGNPKKDPANPDSVLTEEVRGTIKITDSRTKPTKAPALPIPETFADFVRVAQMNVPEVAAMAAEAATRNCAREIDALGRLGDALLEADDAKENNDPIAYAERMAEIAALALAQVAMAKVPGCDLLR